MTRDELPPYRPLLYVAGPYSLHPTHCTTFAARVAMAIFEHTPYVPLVPHLSHHWDAVTPRPYETWLKLDVSILIHCDRIVRLPGRSSGADREMRIARHLGLYEVSWWQMPPAVLAAYEPYPHEIHPVPESERRPVNLTDQEIHP